MKHLNFRQIIIHFIAIWFVSFSLRLLTLTYNVRLIELFTLYGSKLDLQKHQVTAAEMTRFQWYSILSVYAGIICSLIASLYTSSKNGRGRAGSYIVFGSFIIINRLVSFKFHRIGNITPISSYLPSLTITLIVCGLLFLGIGLFLFFSTRVNRFINNTGVQSSNYSIESDHIPKTEIELENWMKENCFNFNSYSINGNSIFEGFGIDKTDGLYIWYFTERGQKRPEKHFSSEKEIIEHAFDQIKTDIWAKTHCIGLSTDQDKINELKNKLHKKKIEFIEDRIPYSDIDRPVYRVFVFGCDIKKTKHFKETYWTEKQNSNFERS